MKPFRIVLLVSILALAALAPTTASAKEAPECRDDGWTQLTSEPGGEPFKNQGQCVAHKAQGGTLFPVGGDDPFTFTGFLHVGLNSTTNIPSCGGPVVLMGTGFDEVVDVSFNGVPVEFVIDSDVQITTNAPDPTSEGEITVTSNAGSQSQPYSVSEECPGGDPGL